MTRKSLLITVCLLLFLFLSRGITYADPTTDTTTDINIDLTGGNPGTTASGDQGSLLEWGMVQQTNETQVWGRLEDGTWGPTGQTGTITYNQSQPQPGGGYFRDVNGNLTQDPNQDAQQGILTEAGYVSNNTSQEWIDRINNASSRGAAIHAAALCGCWRSVFGDDGDGDGSPPIPTPTPTPTPIPPAGNWLKVSGGTVFSRGAINMSVAPPSGQFNSTSLVLSGGSISNFTSSANWLVPNYFSSDSIPDFDNFVKSLLSKSGVERYEGSRSLSSLGSLDNQKKAVIIEGDMVIDTNFTPANASTAFIVKNKINISPSVSQVNAILLSWGGIDTAVSSTRLTVNGMLLSYGHITLGRTSSDPNSPAETVNYEPRLLLDMIDILTIVNIKYKIVNRL
ncbi:hypothetical protein HYT17_01570 [Candidatus Microgenomates bacterium]|nr:hypothetical protein [Candidatus Microgenomates bacterium]